MRIRRVQEGDEAALMALYNGRGAASKRTFRAFGRDCCDLAQCAAVIAADREQPPRGYDVVAELPDRFGGWGFVWQLTGCEPLFGLVVADDLQGRGLGRALAQAALAGVDALGVDQVHLTVVDDNASAIGLYARLGFVDTGGFVHDDGLPYRRMVRRRPGA